jgi:integrase
LWAREDAGHLGSEFLGVSDAYLASLKPNITPGSYMHYEIALENLGITFSKFRLEQLEPQHVKAYIRRRTKKGAALFEKRILSAMFNWAREEGITKAPNPCAGIKFSKSERKAIGKLGRRDRYVTDAEFAEVHGRALPILQDAMDLGLRTGQRPSDLLKMTRHDIRDGELWIVQVKTSAKVTIRIEGKLKAALERILARPRRVQSLYLIATDDGQRMTYDALNSQFVKARRAAMKETGMLTWQFRDIRAKAATDSPDIKRAQDLLGHASELTTAGYRRNKGVAVAPNDF